MKHSVITSKRAGQYVEQEGKEGNYRAFIPASLPPEPPVRLGAELQSLLSTADRALGRLDGSIQTLPEPDLVVLMYMRKEAVLSSRIEGTQSSLQDVLAAEVKALSRDRPRDTGEVINYLGAMRYGLEHMPDRPVSVQLMCAIHGRLMRGVRGSHLKPGKVRNRQNWIGPDGCSPREATFVPPPPHAVPDALRALEDFLNDPGELPKLIWIGLAHAQFETIHPFLDGNGRIGRLLITFLLCKQDMLQQPVLYLSHFFRKHQQEYYACLQSVRDRGAWEKWLGFFLRGVAEVSAEATATARAILILREEHRGLITEHFGRGAGNGHRVLEQLYRNPVVSVKVVQDWIGTTYSTANDLVGRMVACGILQEFTKRSRNRAFWYNDYIRLFHDDEQES